LYKLKEIKNIILFEQITEKLTPEELESAYKDLVEWNQNGVLKMESVIRNIRNQFNKENNVEIAVHVMENVILNEIAKRHYGF